MDAKAVLFDAVDRGDVAAAARLLALNPQAIEARIHGATALHRAAAHGDLALLELLVRHGAAIEACDDAGATALGWASEADRDEAVGWLLEQGAHADAVELAAHGDISRLAELLDESPWMLEQRNVQGSTLHAAVRRGRLAAVEFLLQRGASLTEHDDEGRTPLQLARESGQRAIEARIEECHARGGERTDRSGARAASVLESVTYGCGACGEPIVIEVDRTEGLDQRLIEDCPVCCHPNVIDVSLESGSAGQARANLE